MRDEEDAVFCIWCNRHMPGHKRGNAICNPCKRIEQCDRDVPDNRDNYDYAKDWIPRSPWE